MKGTVTNLIPLLTGFGKYCGSIPGTAPVPPTGTKVKRGPMRAGMAIYTRGWGNRGHAGLPTLVRGQDAC